MSITIPTNVKTIESYAFAYCANLTSVTISRDVSKIEDCAFAGNVFLNDIKVSTDNRYYRSVGNCLIDIAQKTIIAGCRNSVIPSDGSVTKIGDSAFSGVDPMEITIPAGITSIGNHAFSSCRSLMEIVIPEGVTSIGDFVFVMDFNLTSITLPVSLKSIGMFTFNNTWLTDVYYAGTMTQWNQIQIGSNNDDLYSSTIHCIDGDIIS